MTFQKFQTIRPRLLADRPELLDCGETNLYRALARLMPEPVPPVEGTVHRCHLASQWTEFYSLPEAASRRAFITEGVRDGLDTLFAHLAGKQCLLWLPEDNYPVYRELAAAHGHQVRTFPTLPEVRWPDEPPPSGVDDEWLLVTHPLKPRGGPLSPESAGTLREWLAASDRRRVLLDTVYQLDSRFDDITLQLLETGQAVLLHSVTKGWLHPRCFGVVLMPERDADEWMPVFRAKVPTQANLVTARYLMALHAEMPGKVKRELQTVQIRLLERLKRLPFKILPVDPASYFMPVEGSWEELLEHGILGLPASTFGSGNSSLTILTSLHFLS
ncbi:MAG: aspartate aminotransferase [Verrucomicrobiaceae bacterium]|nr:MAG: aspartate aminotransferase [Verrucomicrobiaceae bacterium]